MSEPRYSWSVNEEHYHGDFATVEDAIEEAAAEEPDAEAVFVGEKDSPIQPEDWWNADDWLEHVSCQDEYSGEFAEDWDNSTKEQQSELEAEVRKVMATWLDRHNLRPGFWLIRKAKKYLKNEGKWSASDKESKS